MWETLESIARDLEDGRRPFMMWHSHVVMVYSLHYEYGPTGITRAVLEHYDSNRNQPVTRTIAFDEDGLPARHNRMIWNITPRRGSWRCH